MGDDERKSLTWFLRDSSRQAALATGESHQEVHKIVKPDIQPLWNWFRAQTEIKMSIFGLCFR